MTVDVSRLIIFPSRQQEIRVVHLIDFYRKNRECNVQLIEGESLLRGIVIGDTRVVVHHAVTWRREEKRIELKIS